VLAAYIEVVVLVEPVDIPRIVPSDADDDHVIAAAVTAYATLIVSGDTDLLSLKQHQNIQIMSAAMVMDPVFPLFRQKND
jgi:uncharacterized protein